MFKKPNKKFRQRKRADDDSDEDTTCAPKTEIENVTQKDDNISQDDLDVSPQVQPASETKDQQQVKSTLQRLTVSFDGDEDEDEFKIKKSSYSKRVARQLEKEKKKREKEIQEKEREAQRIAEESVKKKEQEELEIVWINSEKKSEVNENETDDVQEVIQVPEEDHFSDDDEEDESNGDMGHDGPQFRSVLERGYIPDAKTIFALKKKRQMARNIDDFIALSTEMIPDNNRSHDNRDDDDDQEVITIKSKNQDEDDEEFEDDRIEFNLDQETLEKEQVRQAFLDAQDEDRKGGVRKFRPKYSDEDDSEDEESQRWETEQIKKGFGISNTDRLRARVEAELGGNQMVIDDENETTGIYSSSSGIKQPAAIPSHLNDPFDPNTPSLTSVLDQLSEMMKENHEKIDHFERQLVNIGIQTEIAEDELRRLEEKRTSLLNERKEMEETHVKSKNSDDNDNHDSNDFKHDPS